MNSIARKKLGVGIGEIIRFAYLFIIIFLFSTEFPLVAGLTTRRLVMLYALMIIAIKSGKVKAIWKMMSKRKIRAFFLLLFGAFAISLVHSFGRVGVSNNTITYSEPWYYVYIVLYILVFSLFCFVEFKSLKEFGLVLGTVMLFQTFIVLNGVMDPSFRTYIYETYNYNESNERFFKTIEDGFRFVGIGLVGADGSVKLSTAAIGFVALKLTNNLKPLLFWIFYVALMIGTVFVGRTGVLVELALLFFVALNGEGKVKGILTIVVLAILAATVIMEILSYLDPVASEAMVEWMTESFDSESRAKVNEGVLQGGMPPFSSEFIFGTGMDTGYSLNGKVYTSDSGLIRTYMASGIIGFLLYYLALYNLLTSTKPKRLESTKKLFFYLCIALAFIIEYKEPFMMKYVFPWSMLTIMLLYLKDNLFVTTIKR